MENLESIIAIAGVAIALFEIAIAIYKYISETERQKYMDTISVFNHLFEDTYCLRESYLAIFPGTLFLE